MRGKAVKQKKRRRRRKRDPLCPPWLSPPGVLPNPPSKFIHPLKFSINISRPLPSYNSGLSRSSRRLRRDREFKRMYVNLESVSPNVSPETSPEGWIRDRRTVVSSSPSGSEGERGN
jgi:hypothetical protein